ncbi:MAG: RluA family pseudouridine synthase [Bacteroidales bacterium]|nr:RluA family pseudouridine synthase [Candidatus Liminaster caballi]
MKQNSNHRGRRRPDHVEVFNPSAESTLLSYLFEVLAPRSRSEIKSYLVHSQVMVNDTPTTQFDTPLMPGDSVTVNFSRPYVSLDNRMCRMIWEDDDIIVVEKQSGLLTVPAGRQREKTAQQIVDDYVYAQDGRSHAYVCHRLDQFTSGILIFAKNSSVQQRLRDAWNTYVVERMYMAVCEGMPKDPEGEVKSYLVENSAMKVYSTNDPSKGKLSVTRYKVVRTNGNFSLIDIQILTGRKNQIRVHMSDLGCPVTGDKKYGAKYNPCGRLMLHNYALQFIHPVTRQNLRFELPLPANFKV